METQQHELTQEEEANIPVELHGIARRHGVLSLNMAIRHMGLGQDVAMVGRLLERNALGLEAFRRIALSLSLTATQEVEQAGLTLADLQECMQDIDRVVRIRQAARPQTAAGNKIILQ